MKLNTRALLGVWVISFIVVLSAGAEQQEGATSILASQIIDHDVIDANQELIGEVDDIIFKRSGKAKTLTVDFGGFLDTGDKLVALPFKRFSMKNISNC